LRMNIYLSTSNNTHYHLNVACRNRNCAKQCGQGLPPSSLDSVALLKSELQSVSVKAPARRNSSCDVPDADHGSAARDPMELRVRRPAVYCLGVCLYHAFVFLHLRYKNRADASNRALVTPMPTTSIPTAPDISLTNSNRSDSRSVAAGTACRCLAMGNRRWWYQIRSRYTPITSVSRARMTGQIV
jgi:hypothetical protein